MKAYTDLEQSKKLAEILPMESADMRYHTISQYNLYPCDEIVYTIDFGKPSDIDTPCWSLAALLEELPDKLTTDDGIDYNLTICKEEHQYYLYYHDFWVRAEDIETNYCDDFVDACYEMILKLHLQKLL